MILVPPSFTDNKDVKLLNTDKTIIKITLLLFSTSPQLIDQLNLLKSFSHPVIYLVIRVLI